MEQGEKYARQGGFINALGCFSFMRNSSSGGDRNMGLELMREKGGGER